MKYEVQISNAWVNRIVNTAATVGYLTGYHDALRSLSLSADYIRQTDYLQLVECNTEVVSYIPVKDLSGACAIVDFAAQEATAVGTTSRPIDVQSAIDLVVAQHQPRMSLGSREEQLFHDRLQKWKADIAFESSPKEFVLHPEYLKIIGMGRAVVPLLLQELMREPCWVFWALESITGEQPAHKSDQGNLRRLTSAWLAWGRKNGYIKESIAQPGFSKS